MRTVNLVMGFFAVLILVLLGLVIYDEFVVWPNYKAQHDCKLSGKEKEEVISVCEYNAALDQTMCLPKTVTKREYKCDNGSVWR